MPNGDPTVTINLANGQDYKNKEGQLVEVTEWIRVVVFGRLAEVCRDYLHKGDKVYIEGKWRTRKWDDQKTGVTRYSTECVMSQMEMLGGKKNDPQGSSQGSSQPAQGGRGPTGTNRDQHQSDPRGGPPADYDANADMPF